MKNFNQGGGRSYDRGGDRAGGRSYDRGGDRGGDRQMHQTICSECGRSCEVPFKPTGSKPVYCSNCFNKGDSPAPRRAEPSRSYEPSRSQDAGRSYEPKRSADPSRSNEKNDSMNAKLDKIIVLLEAMVGTKTTKSVEKKETDKASKRSTTSVVAEGAPKEKAHTIVKKAAEKVEAKKTAVKAPAKKKAKK